VRNKKEISRLFLSLKKLISLLLSTKTKGAGET
jgi:hypothetical protein